VARQAAEAAACAEEQGNKYFWNVHDLLSAHQRELTPDNLQRNVYSYVSQLDGFNSTALARCLDEKRTAAVVDRDIALGKEVEITATPTLFINGHRVVGYRPKRF